MKRISASCAVALCAFAAFGAIDQSEWKLANCNWGGKDRDGADYNGGVVPENVRFESGKAYLSARGNRYTGDVRGVGKKGLRLNSGVRSGACLVSKKRFHFGRYEVRMKIAPVMGCCTAMWTFRYAETDTGILNHEIDIELPGRPEKPFEGIDFDHALCNTWIGEEEERSTIGYTKLPRRLDDGEFHDFRFDWHYDRVDYYVDGEKVRTNRSHVPNMPGEFWVGVWFPRGWAGTPDFDTAEAVVEDFRFTPFDEESSGALEATVPDAGESVPLRNKFCSDWLGKPAAARCADLENDDFRHEMFEAGSLPRPVRLAWLGGDGDSRLVVVRAADGKVVVDEKVLGNDFVVENLEANCSYKWTCRSLGLETSSTFRTEDAFPRQLHWAGVKNVRDLGGRPARGGRRVRQGLVYRSGGFESCTEEEVTNASGKVIDYIYPMGRRTIKPEGVRAATVQCGVKTDLDLRWDEECKGLAASALGKGVKLVHVPFFAYEHLAGENGRKAFKKAFAVFLDESNYPIDFHGIAGADRTGTLAFVLNALLGVEEDELVRDWEASAFSTQMPSFTHERRFRKLLSVFDKYPGATLCERVEGFVLDCGFPKSAIEKFRGIMIE
ncbi:MAG: tyrosine-protein phosphatase [Kiritimatiellae bacterium]|nr:tyrosine-protein phosphatase [Kiritimatiellia bacterium]